MTQTEISMHELLTDAGLSVPRELRPETFGTLGSADDIKRRTVLLLQRALKKGYPPESVVDMDRWGYLSGCDQIYEFTTWVAEVHSIIWDTWTGSTITTNRLSKR